jgi:protein tyrosine/serine phosphatase
MIEFFKIIKKKVKMSRNHPHRMIFFVLSALSLAQISCCNPASKDKEYVIPSATTVMKTRQWATKISLQGVPNFHKVSEDLYRGAQPNKKGMRQLEKFGIKTIVNLRSFHSDRDEIKQTNLNREHIYMKAWHPEEKEVVRFLKIVTDQNRTPVFVHCQHGADRTGTMCAIYRIAVQGWSKDEAIEEMTKGDFGFHKIWGNLPDYIRKINIEKIKQEAGIKY